MSYCPPTTPPNCFKDIIGLRGCVSPVSTSGFYLDEVGVTMEELNQFITGQYTTGEKLFKDKLNFTIKLIVDSIHTNLSSRYKAISLIDSARAGIYLDNKESVAGQANMLKGILYEFANTDSYVDLFIASISLHTDFTGDIPIYIYDLIQNKLLDTIILSSTAEQISTVYVNKSYKSDRKKLHLAVVYDSENINAYKGVLKKGCSTCGSEPFLRNNYTTIHAIKLPELLPKIRNNVSLQDNTGGMSIEYSISCNHTDYLCVKNNMIAIPVVYRTAAELMEYGINIAVNKRTNTTVTINRDVLKDRFDFYFSRYQQSMKDMLGNMLLPTDSKCFICNEKGKHAIILP